jgi:hypothetical protein
MIEFLLGYDIQRMAEILPIMIVVGILILTLPSRQINKYLLMFLLINAIAILDSYFDEQTFVHDHIIWFIPTYFKVHEGELFFNELRSISFDSSPVICGKIFFDLSETSD